MRTSIVSPDNERVTFVELFFDLVFVFAMTQTAGLLRDGPAWPGRAGGHGGGVLQGGGGLLASCRIAGEDWRQTQTGPVVSAQRATGRHRQRTGCW